MSLVDHRAWWQKLWQPASGLESIGSLRRRHAGYDDLRDEICRMGTDSLSYFGNGYRVEGGLSLQQHPDELTALILFLQENGPFARYLEIGSASGGTCLLLYRKLGFTEVVSMDDGKHPRAGEQRGNFAEIPGARLFVGDSHSEAAAAFLHETLTGSLDLAFIDGDHSYEGVWQDLQLTLRFATTGTLCVFHDIVACDGVRTAWQEAAAEQLLKPLAEFVGRRKPLGIGVAAVPTRERDSMNAA